MSWQDRALRLGKAGGSATISDFRSCYVAPFFKTHCKSCCLCSQSWFVGSETGVVLHFFSWALLHLDQQFMLPCPSHQDATCLICSIAHTTWEPWTQQPLLKSSCTQPALFCLLIWHPVSVLGLICPLAWDAFLADGLQIVSDGPTHSATHTPNTAQH